MSKLGNSGAPRWYDNDRERFVRYVEFLSSLGASATEIVLHNGDADEFTGRVHVLRHDWNAVVRAYRDAGIAVYFHGSLTREFSLANWSDDPAALLDRYDALIRFAGEVADDQGTSTLVLHGSGDPSWDLDENERMTVEFLNAISDRVGHYSPRLRLAIELRAVKDRRPTAAATTRDSVQRIAQRVDHPQVGVCWDVAHDVENAIAAGETWTLPDAAFLRYVIHLHLHDIGDDGEPHCPPILGRVPVEPAIEVAGNVPGIMEVRWRMAERMGDPWEILAESYRQVLATVSRRDTCSPSNRS